MTLRHLRSWFADAPQDRVSQPGRSVDVELSRGFAESLPKIVLYAERAKRGLPLSAFPWRHHCPFVAYIHMASYAH
jgi:hypothetical protein